MPKVGFYLYCLLFGIIYYVIIFKNFESGLWCYIHEESWPSLTIIGSSNYGYRSTERDLEAQAILITNNIQLRKKIHEVRYWFSLIVVHLVFDNRNFNIFIGIGTYI